MKSFHCDSCGMMVFFQNDHCVKCGHPLGFLPDVLDLSALEKTPDNQWRPLSPAAHGRIYRNCTNGSQFNACNWLVPAVDPNPWCPACRLNILIPNVTDEKNLERWKKLEHAKRRCLDAFMNLGLPIEAPAGTNLPALRFRFLENQPGGPPVTTGHQDGLITINVAEADDDEREHRRVTLHEPYRTLVGHMRHECGHFYWNRLIAHSPHLDGFRKLFGDETQNYDVALKAYYQQGPSAGWQERTVTVYASSHPWEDWAETWAHYLHIMDTLETASSFGVGVNPDNAAQNGTASIPALEFGWRMDFDALLAAWIPLTCALNSINRGMGLSDLYPFVIPPAVVEKLRFIHTLIRGLPGNTTS